MDRNSYTQPSYGRPSMMPPVIMALIAINVIVFVIDLYVVKNNLLSAYGALWPVGSEYFEPWQYLTTMFLHATPAHLMINMFVLWMFGLEIAGMWGTKRFLLFYLLCGLGASALHSAITAISGGTAPAVGASGAISGVVIAFAMLFPNRMILLFFFIPMKAKWAALLYIGYGLISGIQMRPGDNIAHFAHLGGAITGFILLKTGLHALLLSKLERKKTAERPPVAAPPPRAPLSQTDSRQHATIVDARFREITPPAPMPPSRNAIRTFDYGDQQAQIDALLDKVSQYGYNSLTDEEKQTLMDVSRRME